MTIYLDHAATAPINDAAIDALNTQMRKLGNPSSTHNSGRSVRKDVEDARHKLAQLLGASPSEIIFTGSGTEADNLAIKGFFWQFPERNVIVTSAFEHHAILDPAHWLEVHEGAEIIQIPVNANGVIDIEFLAQLVTATGNEIAVISVMHANNETGVIQPIAKVVEIAGEIPVHTDAAQSFKKVPLSFADLGVYAMSLSAHKVGGPLGIGALILRRAVEIPALLHGGGQEREIRSGTLNAPAIVAFAAAAKSKYYDVENVSALRDSFIAGITSALPEVIINGLKSDRLPGIVNVTFPGTQSDTLLLLMDAQHISCSTGSACSAGVHEASHVLLAMGHSEVSAQSSLRFSFGATSTNADVDFAVSVMPDVITRGRAANLS